MEVLNQHERELSATRLEVGALLDSLASREDRLWPNHRWPRMKFDRPLEVGATGGHGPIRYHVETYSPGESIQFRFLAPAGFDGYHRFEIVDATGTTVVLRHTLKMTTRGAARLSWLLLFRPLHDALLEDSLAKAEASLGIEPKIKRWSIWVRFLRWVASKRKLSTKHKATP